MFKSFSNIIISIIVAGLLTGIIYVTHLQNKVQSLSIDNNNLKTEIKVKETNATNKVFEAKQQAKKQQILKQLKKDENVSKKNSDVGLSIGSHTINF